MICDVFLYDGFLKTIVFEKGSSLTIAYEGLSLTIVNETMNDT